MEPARSRETGIALVITLLLMFVFTLMTLGFYYLVTGEQKMAVSDRDNTVAFYGAQAGLEKMSADLAALFVAKASPTPTDIDTLTTSAMRPSISGITYRPTGGYQIVYQTNGSGGLQSTTGQIGGSGPLVGLQGVITPMTLTVIAQGPNGTEVKFTREVQEVAVPVFQFGIFSENDLSFFAGPNFNFGGRVHTNGHLFVAEGDGNTLTLADKNTTYQEVIRTELSNGWPTSSNYNGTVNVEVTPGNYRHLDQTEGSIVGGPGSAANPRWPILSLSTYNGNIRNKLTGARKLRLALALGPAGTSPIEIIRRPLPGEDPTTTLGDARFYNQASLRILLSDSTANIMTLPGIDTSKSPYPLDETLISRTTSTGPVLPPVSACNPPLPQSRGYAVDHDYMSPPGTSLLAGAATSYIKIEIQLNAARGTWQDVTKEVLSLGISKDLGPSCANKSIIHLEQLRPSDPSPGSTDPTDYVPINLYDPREGEVRDNSGPTTLALGGVMNIVELDVHNLQSWFANTLDPLNAPSGALALNNGGYIVYTSDRRGNVNNSNAETGEYGFEDIINPNDPAGNPNNTLDPGEDVNGNGTLETYGGKAHPVAVDNSAESPWPTRLPTASPVLTRVTGNQGLKNDVIFFRRALRLVNGAMGNLPPLAHANCGNPNAGGFTVASENPIYVLGDYNASPTTGFTDGATACHVPAAVIGDAVTLLSNAYKDSNGFALPTSFGSCSSSTNRCAATTYYRAAVVSGKNYSFTQPTWSGVGRDFGTDGGAHNFLRYIENWGGQTLNYRGSIVSFYIARQAVGIFKCCNVVYSPPTRGYNFDVDFTNISTLPPGTPRFSDVNALSFAQSILPN